MTYRQPGRMDTERGTRYVVQSAVEARDGVQDTDGAGQGRLHGMGK